MNVNFLNGQATLSLTEPQEMRMIEAAAIAYATAKAEADKLATVYTMNELPARLNISRSTILKYLQLPVKNGGLRARQAGAKWLVTEKACREWLGDDEPEK